MIGWIFGLLGVGSIAGVLALYLLAPAAFLVAWTFVKGVFNTLMKISVPLLLAGIVLLVCSGFLIWRWGIADHGRKVAEKQIVSVTGERDKARADLSACHANVDALTVSLEAQNAAVDRLKAEGDERTRRANAAIQKAQAQAKALQGRISRLENAKPASGDLCSSARSLIIDTLEEDR